MSGELTYKGVKFEWTGSGINHAGTVTIKDGVVEVVEVPAMVGPSDGTGVSGYGPPQLYAPATQEMQEVLKAYWNAASREEQHRVYVGYLRLGGPPAYGESTEEVEKIKACPDCDIPPEGEVPLSERGFGT